MPVHIVLVTVAGLKSKIITQRSILRLIMLNYHIHFYLWTGHYLSPGTGGGKEVGGVMKKLEIDRGGSLLFWLIKQGGEGGHDFF